jgi:hypothetical protein
MTVQLKADPSLQALAREAIAIQNACNGCGLAQRFAAVMVELIHHPQSQGTGWANQHPVTKLWIDKFTSLARMPQSLECVSYEQVEKLARGEEVEIQVV